MTLISNIIGSKSSYKDLCIYYSKYKKSYSTNDSYIIYYRVLIIPNKKYLIVQTIHILFIIVK